MDAPTASIISNKREEQAKTALVPLYQVLPYSFSVIEKKT
jgi:hypothetical protein